jgi:hypothetical protein
MLQAIKQLLMQRKLHNMEQHTTQPWIAVCTPSRGMVFTEVIEYVEDMRSTYPNMRHFLTHDLPIPECFNTLVERVMSDPKYEYIFWIEEDTVPPALTLDKFLEAMKEYDMAACDYGFNGGWNTIVRSEVTQEILFSGFGCTFMKRHLFDIMPRPWFKADRAFNISNMQWYPVDPAKAYGMYDIDWGSRIREKGFKIGQIEGECRHLQLIQLGQKEVNAGLHVITEKDRIAKKLTLPITNL